MPCASSARTPDSKWWNGSAWGPAAANGAGGFRPTTQTWVVLGVVGFVATVAASTGGAGAFLTVVGLGAVAAAVVALVRGGIPSLALRSPVASSIALISGLVVAVIGGGVSAVTSVPAAPQSVSAFVDPDQSGEERPTSAPPDSAPLLSKPAPVVVITTIDVEEPIPFASVTVDDPNLPAGTSVVTTAGVAGVLVVTYRVTTTDGVETARVRLSETVGVAPTDEVTSRGTYVALPPPASNGCDPNYSGGCVPIASDVDCAGGGGNGPAYFSGTAIVVGRDIYGLDRDHDGIACE